MEEGEERQAQERNEKEEEEEGRGTAKKRRLDREEGSKNWKRGVGRGGNKNVIAQWRGRGE